MCKKAPNHLSGLFFFEQIYLHLFFWHAFSFSIFYLIFLAFILPICWVFVCDFISFDVAIGLFFKWIHCEEKKNSPQRERKKVFNPTCYWYFKTPGCCLPSCNICLAIVLQLKNCSIHHFKRAIWCCFLYDVVEEVQTLYYYILALPSFGFRVEGYFEKTIEQAIKHMDCLWQERFFLNRVLWRQ